MCSSGPVEVSYTLALLLQPGGAWGACEGRGMAAVLVWVRGVTEARAVQSGGESTQGLRVSQGLPHDDPPRTLDTTLWVFLLSLLYPSGRLGVVGHSTALQRASVVTCCVRGATC